MGEIHKPLGVPELELQPPITGRVRLSEDMQQTLALLCAMGNSKRILLRASESGGLLIDDPVIKDIIIEESAAGTGLGQGSDIVCSQVMVMAHPDNTNISWVRPYKAVDGIHGWPLDSYDVIKFTVNNVNQIHFLCLTAGGKLIIAYAR